MTKIDLSTSSSMQSKPATSSGNVSMRSAEYEANLRIVREMYPGRLTVSVKEASLILGVSDDFLYERLASASISASKAGRHWKIPLTEIARLLTEGVK